MYCPYLFDKQSELLALRSLAGQLGSPQKIVPLIEPVAPADGLARWYSAFKKSGDYGYVVENPHQIKLSDAKVLAAWQTDTAALFADANVVRPTFKERAATSLAEITSFVAKHPGRSIGLVVTTAHIPAVDIAQALAKADYVVFATSGADRMSLVTHLGPSKLVEINDRFPSQARNADYDGEEWFSRDHLDFAANGYAGFSDYTVLPPRPNKSGGGSVGAVAVHLTFTATDGSLWVEHFLSDERRINEGTVGGKLLEACHHIELTASANPVKFDKSAALGHYRAIFASGAESSLGKNKELEVAHHIFTVGQRLGI